MDGTYEIFTGRYDPYSLFSPFGRFLADHDMDVYEELQK
jgi:hypothetical protein